jgi:phage terminase large subunit-like protein
VRLERSAHIKFSEAHAQRAVRFFEECLVHTQGRFAGAPFLLTPWQKEDIREIFGRVDDEGNRVVRIVYIEIPKKNGKSVQAAGVALKLLFADDEPSAEVYGAAADRDQACVIYNLAARMVERNGDLSRLCDVLDSTKRILLHGDRSYYRALSAETVGKQGFNSHGVIFDEVHEQETMRLWETLTFGAGAARAQPLVYAITTSGIPGECPVAEMLHDEADSILRGVTPCPDTFYPVMYGAEPTVDWSDENVWRDCNPALGTRKDLGPGKAFLDIAAVRDEFDRARRHPREENAFRRLRLNQWVAQDTRVIRMEDWDANGLPDGPALPQSYAEWVASEVRELKHLTWYAGLDLSTKLDLTALALVCRDANDGIHILPWFWVPEGNLEDRGELERERLKRWIRDGFVTATPGKSVDFATVRERVQLCSQVMRVVQVAFDPQFATETANLLTASGQVMVEMRQGGGVYTEPWNALEAALQTHKLYHGGHPVLRWNADCFRLRQNARGQVWPVKPDRKKSSKRIDGLVAALMALSRALVDNSNRVSVYSDAATAVI